jgi:hypothetical protein
LLNVLVSLLPPGLQLLGLFDGVSEKVAPEAWSVLLPEGELDSAIPTPLIGGLLNDYGLLEFDILSLEELDVSLTLIAVSLDADAVLFNDDFAFKALTAIRSVHLLMQANHNQDIFGALGPV